MSPDGISIDLPGGVVIDDWHSSEVYKRGTQYHAGTARFTAFRYRIRQNHLIMPPGEL